ncbi:MAG: S8 family peptidase [Methylococcaceae bacterium]|nr:S8 family peptidase [Methylococcaceae bacterium]
MLNQRTRNVETIDLGLDNREATPEILKRAQNAKAARSFTGKIHNGLKATLYNLKLKPTTEVEVVVWAKMPYALPSYDWDALARQGQKQVEETERFALTVAATLHTQATSPILDFAFKQGWKIGYQSDLAPIVTLQLPANQVQLLESRTDVVAIFPDDKAELALNTSATAIGVGGTGGVWGRGITGTGVSVAVVESDAIFFDHPNLQDGTLTNSLINSPVGDHATHVAGIIASTHNTNRGIAFGVPALISANASTGSLADGINATSSAITLGARILNYSIGANSAGNPANTLNGWDYLIDYITDNFRLLSVVAAGNTNLCGNSVSFVTSPGKAYSAITVGNYDHHTNAIAPSSCFGNPSSGMEKPEVAAPGTDILSTVTGNLLFNGLTGTSMAAPHVSGCAALLMQRRPALQNQPEAVKAVLMASAVRNIEGDKTLSDRDGVGGVVCDAADDILQANGEAHQVVTAPGIGWNSDNHSFTVTAGETVRVVIAWGSHPNNNLTADNLSADFDLHVSGPILYGNDGAWCQGCHHSVDVGGDGVTGVFYTGSYSVNNAYEIVEFVAPLTGTYTASANQKKPNNQAVEHLAFAWWHGQRRN